MFSSSRVTQVANLNRHLDGMDQDYLYHIGLEKRGDNLKRMFGDVKVIQFFANLKGILEKLGKN